MIVGTHFDAKYAKLIIFGITLFCGPYVFFTIVISKQNNCKKKSNVEITQPLSFFIL